MDELKEFLVPLVHTENFTTLPLAGDASSRRYYRIVTERGSWVLMQWEPFQNPDEFPFLSVQKYFAKYSIPVPKVHHYDEKTGLFLLEDLGDLTLERMFWEYQNPENVLPYYKAVVDELIKIHSLVFDKKNGLSCTAYNEEFSVEKLMWEFNYMKQHLFEQLLGLDLSDSCQAKLKTLFTSICTDLHSLPQVICHRDFHSRNVMLKYGKIFIIDFQDARMGPAVYDLVSLLLDSYVDLPPGLSKNLLDYYAQSFPHFDKVAESRQQFQTDFDRQSIQRCLKACGSFASFYNTRGDERYLKYISPTLTLVQNQLKKFPEYSLIDELLEDTKTKWSEL